jgi:cellobiose-specific phosphotransferase system component IIC
MLKLTRKMKIALVGSLCLAFSNLTPSAPAQSQATATKNALATVQSYISNGGPGMSDLLTNFQWKSGYASDWQQQLAAVQSICAAAIANTARSQPLKVTDCRDSLKNALIGNSPRPGR